MLRALAVRHFTIIDAIELEFRPGFGAITGETGAGKSILIDALALLLGDRADASTVADGHRQAELGATFELAAGHPARDWLAEQALAEDETLILRRVIPAEGASRAWINGQPATAGQLRELGALLVEIHGQHEHQRLTDPARQRDWLDRQIKADARTRLKDAFEHWRRAREALDALLEGAGDADRLDRLRFDLEQLDKLALQDGEFAQLEADQRRLASVDELKRAFAGALEAIDGEDAAARQSTLRARRALEAVADRESELADVLEMLTTAAVNLDEAATTLTRLDDGLEDDPTRLEQIERRMSQATGLARRHSIEPDELPTRQREIEQQLQALERFDSERANLTAELEIAEQNWRDAATGLNKARASAGKRIAADVRSALAELGMADSRFEFRIEHDPEARVGPHGADRIEILFSANPGQAPKPMRKIASGGELSRLSLAMIIASAEPDAGEVRIFDEIDAGVGGETANAVGRFLKRAGSGGQALCVTHLPQVAARADYQFSVGKRAIDGATRVEIESLSRDRRIEELARMLGSKTSTAGLRHAEELLGAE